MTSTSSFSTGTAGTGTGTAGSDFVGRTAELDRLDLALSEAVAGRGSTLVISGPAGVGKSTLLAQFARRHQDDAVVLIATCRHDSREPFGPWIEMLAHAERLRDPGGSGPARRGGEPRIVADQLLTTWAQFDRPVVAVVDDWHWSDTASRQVVDLVHANLLNERVVLLLSRRPALPSVSGRSMPLRSLTPLHEVSLDGLSAAEIAAWLAARYRMAVESPTERATLDAAAVRLNAECGGNPLAISARLSGFESDPGLELLRRVVDSPPSVHATSSRRWVDELIDRLPAVDRRVLGISLLTGDLTRSEVCTATGIDLDGLERARRAAADIGLIPDPWSPTADIHPLIVDCLVDRLEPADADQAHLAIGRFLLARAPDRALDAAHHFEQAITVVDRRELVDVLDRAGRWAHQHFAHDDAARLLATADELAPDDTGRLQRTMVRADVARVRGDFVESSRLSHTAARLAASLGDADAYAESASGYSFPMEWRSGDSTALRLLEDALAAGPSAPWRATLMAKIAEHRTRTPRASLDGRQWAWAVDAPANQELVAEAVALARRTGDEFALMATLASWRSLHRSPMLLDERRAISGEMLRMAERLRRPVDAVHAAVRCAVDELEAGHREGFEQATVFARWIADQENSPYLLWRAHCLEATRAMLDADLDAFHRSRLAAEEAGRISDAPGRHVSETVHLFLDLDLAGNLGALDSTTDPSGPTLQHPLGIASWAWVLARLGRHGITRRLLARLTWPVDPDSSMLLVTDLAARAAVMSDDHATIVATLPTLERFADHVSVDSEAIWPGAPVAVALAEAYRSLGRHDDHARALAVARQVNATLGDARTAAYLADEGGHPPRSIELTERELVVLRMMAEGHGNAAIATMLHYSVATIRRETTSIYQRFGVSNRAAAVARAHELGLLG